MAQFEKRGNKWRVRITYYDEEGQKKTISKSGFKTKPEAVKYAKSAEANIKEIVSTDHKIVLVDYINEYIENFRVDKYSLSSVDADKYALSKIEEHFSKRLLKNITFTDYQLFIDELIKENYSKSTVTKCHSLMTRAFTNAFRDGLIKKNITEFAEFKYTRKNMPKEKRYLPAEDIKPFLEAVRKRSTIQYYLFRLIIETGLRVGEACALTFQDVDRKHNALHVFKSYDQKRDILGPTKTGNERTVYISKSLSNDLFKLLQIQNAYKIVNNEVYNNKYNFIFVNEIGTPIPRSTIHNTMVQITEKMYGEGNHLSVHELRHTHASLLFESQVPIKAISERLGHKDTQVTEKVYTHLTEEWKKQALKDYEEYIKKVF